MFPLDTPLSPNGLAMPFGETEIVIRLELHRLGAVPFYLESKHVHLPRTQSAQHRRDLLCFFVERQLLIWHIRATFSIGNP